jgi:hypothetical protein
MDFLDGLVLFRAVKGASKRFCYAYGKKQNNECTKRVLGNHLLCLYLIDFGNSSRRDNDMDIAS